MPQWAKMPTPQALGMKTDPQHPSGSLLCSHGSGSLVVIEMGGADRRIPGAHWLVILASQ